MPKRTDIAKLSTAAGIGLLIAVLGAMPTTACVVEIILGIRTDSVQGQVIRAADGVPLEGATVEIWTTDANGDEHSTCQTCTVRVSAVDPKARVEPELVQTDPKQKMLFSIKTGKDGRFSIPGVAPGKYEIVFRSTAGSRGTFLRVVPKNRSHRSQIIAELTSYYGGPRCASIRTVASQLPK